MIWISLGRKDYVIEFRPLVRQVLGLSLTIILPREVEDVRNVLLYCFSWKWVTVKSYTNAHGLPVWKSSSPMMEGCEWLKWVLRHHMSDSVCAICILFSISYRCLKWRYTFEIEVLLSKITPLLIMLG